MTLLPKNATPQELAMEAMLKARFDAMDITIRHFWNPDKCPLEFLPWLAWTYSVDVWSNDWTEIQKRETIKAAYIVHKTKGTAGACKKAVQALGYDITFHEWFEYGGTPGTFRITANSELTSRQIDDITAVVAANKNLRSHFDSLVIPLDSGNNYDGTAMMIHETITITQEGL